MLRPALRHVSYWNGWARWWGNDVNRIGALLGDVDRIAREIGRDPGEIQKTAAVFVRLEGGVDPDNPEAPHLQGSDEEIAAVLRKYAGLGISHMQIVLDPITPDGVERFGRILERMPSPPALSLTGSRAER